MLMQKKILAGSVIESNYASGARLIRVTSRKIYSV